MSGWWRFQAPTRAATKTTCTSPTAHTISGPEHRLATRLSISGARYQVRRRVELFVQINNLFDRKYYTAAQLGPTGFTDSGNYIARPFPADGRRISRSPATFFAPGAPIGAWGGIRFRF